MAAHHHWANGKDTICNSKALCNGKDFSVCFVVPHFAGAFATPHFSAALEFPTSLGRMV